MQRPLEITFRGIEPSEAVERRIREKAERLERFSNEITGCHVIVEAPHKHHHQGQLYSVRLEVRLPGKEIVVGRERHARHAHEDIYVAIRDAFDAAVRQVEDRVRKRRGKVKRHEVPPHGAVSQLFPEKGYGFAMMSGGIMDGVEVYFHANAVSGGGFSELGIGDEVRVVVAEGEGEKGIQASAIVPIGKHHLLAGAKSDAP